MTKTQYHKEVNRRFYKLIEESFPHYILDFNEGGGRVYLFPKNSEIPIGFLSEDLKFITLDYLVYYQKDHYVEDYNFGSYSDFEFEIQILNTALDIIKEEVQNERKST